MFVHKIFNLTTTWRSLSKFSPQVFKYHSSQVEKIEDGVKSSSLDNSEIDTLANELSGPFSSKTLLILESNKDAIKGSHITAVLNSLRKLHRQEIPYAINSASITEEDNFKELFSFIASNLNKLSGSEAIKICEYLAKMKVPDSSFLFQSLLDYLSKCINELTIVEFNVLYNLIRKMKPTKEVQKLKDNLLNKFMAKVTSDFQDNNIDHICHTLAFISSNFPPAKQSQLLGIFIDKLQNYKGVIPSRCLITILEALCFMSWRPRGWIDVLQQVQAELILKESEFNTGQIIYIFFLISEKIKDNPKFHFFYHERLINLFIKKLITEDVGFETALSAVKSLYYVRHKSKELLNYTCASYFEKSVMSDTSIQASEGKLTVLLSGLSSAKHKTVFWDDIQNIFSDETYISKYNHKTLTIVAASLLVLDCYPTAILKKIFDDTFDYSSDTYLHWTIAKIYQKISSNPEYNGPMPSDSLLESLNKLHKSFILQRQSHQHVLSKHLEEGLGGSEFFLNNVGTKQFHVIDHLVVFDKNKAPVSKNLLLNEKNHETNSVYFIEDLNIPPDCKVVTVHLLPNHWFFRNGNELIGLHTLTQESLEKMYLAVTLSGNIWYSIPHKNRTSFLIKELHSKV